jgi:hypothetical protein
MSQIDSAASTGGQRNYINMLASLGLRWWQHCQLQPFVSYLHVIGSFIPYLHVTYDPLIFDRNDLTSVINKYNF